MMEECFMRILFAEDDKDLSKAVKVILERSGYTVDAVYNGRDAFDYVAAGGYDGMILDWMMPGMDGIQVLGKMRKEGISVPCLMLTARDSVEDRVDGLDAGADDYLPKPFATSELLARVRALLRRKENYQPDVISFGDLELDRSSLELRCRQQRVMLNNKAFQLMEMLMENPNMVLSISQIMDKVWGWDSDPEVNVVWVNISFLRKKLAEIGSDVEIKATRGVGYSLRKK